MRTTNKDFSGVGLFEPARIRPISADVSRNFRDYHKWKAKTELTQSDAVLVKGMIEKK